MVHTAHVLVVMVCKICGWVLPIPAKGPTPELCLLLVVVKQAVNEHVKHNNVKLFVSDYNLFTIAAVLTVT